MFFKNSVRVTHRIFLCAFVVLAFLSSQSLLVSNTAHAAVVSSIDVQGAQRMSQDSVLGYVTIRPGRSFSTIDIDDSLKALYATGLFSDVQIFQSGRRLIVKVEENPTINNVVFRGNKKIKTPQLQASLQSTSVGILSDDVLESDRERVIEQYQRIGREDVGVEVRTVPLSNNRVNVVFEISEGDRTKIAKIFFVGNNTFSDSRLRGIIQTKQSGLLSFIRRDDIFDQDRLRADEEVLSRFYFDRGFADFEIVSTNADFNDIDNEYTITITVNEGERYKFGAIEIDSTLRGVDPEQLKRVVTTKSGKTYSAKRVEETIEALNARVATQGFAFSQITPRGERNFENRTVNVIYIIDEGPRAFIERIDISGNNRTRDYVIRREFDIAEGDAYNQVLVDAARRRLNELGYFDSVQITTSQGSAPDRVILNVRVSDKSTGALSFGVGYSSNSGLVGNVSLSESNFLGRGQFLKLSTSLGRSNRDYEFQFVEPYFLGRRIQAGVSAHNRTLLNTNFRPYDSASTGAGFSFGLPLSQNLNAQLSYAFDRNTISNSSQPTLFQNGSTVTSAISYGLTYNTLDNTRNPRDGIFANISQDFAGVGGDVRFLRTTARVSGYKTLIQDTDLVGSINLRGGHITGIGKRLRFIDHFRADSRLIRGFSEGRFGPLTSAGTFVGTDTYIAGTAEISFPFPVVTEGLGIRGALFADAAYLGSATSTFNDGTAFGNGGDAGLVGINSLRTSIGVSILWDSPLGPLRADFARAINKAATDETQVFNFGVTSRF